MSFVEKTGGEKKVQEYIKRIQGGESKEKIYAGLSPVFRESIENGLDSESEKEEMEILKMIPPQYMGLPSYVLEEIWTIPVYVDIAKTKSENDKKQSALSALRKREIETAIISEEDLNNNERVTEILNVLNTGTIDEYEKEISPFKSFSCANGETDTGMFWNQYRNKKAKELKNSGKLEWGRERIYFDIKLSDMKRLSDLVMRIAGENDIAIAFKYLDERNTLLMQKDGRETRFVANFESEDDAKRFMIAIRNDSQYVSFISDRNLSHNGIRLDSIAEYASGFREGRSALERIMFGTVNGDNYTYKTETGKELTIKTSEYLVFKDQYEKIINSMKIKEQQWRQELGLL